MSAMKKNINKFVEDLDIFSALKKIHQSHKNILLSINQPSRLELLNTSTTSLLRGKTTIVLDMTINLMVRIQ